MADYYDSGTVTVSAGSTAVAGAGTSWAGLVRAGDTLEIGGRQMRIASVESSTALTLLLPAPAAASGAYAIWYTAPSRSTGLQALADMREVLAASRILLAQRGDYAVRSATTNAPPASPVTDDIYLIAAAPTGVWAGRAGHLALWTGTGWAYTAPAAGMRALALDTGAGWSRGLSAWAVQPSTFALVASTGSYDDLSDLPDIVPRSGGWFAGNIGIRAAGNTLFEYRTADDFRISGLYSIPGSTKQIFKIRAWDGGGSTYRDFDFDSDGALNLYLAPTADYHATNKGYVDAKAANVAAAAVKDYLPLAGGALTGSLSVSGNITISGTSYASGAVLKSNTTKRVIFSNSDDVNRAQIVVSEPDGNLHLRVFDNSNPATYREVILYNNGLFKSAALETSGEAKIRSACEAYNSSGWGGAIRSYQGAAFSESTRKMSLQKESDGALIYVTEGSNTGAFTFSPSGAFSCSGAKNFVIDHPLDPYNLDLYHVAIESPEALLLYRGTADLVAGVATVDIDAASNMTPGTFAALTADALVQSVQADGSLVRLKAGPITGGSFVITAEDEGFSGPAHWLVSARRNDPVIRAADYTDADGLFRPERIKPDYEEAE
ncbi:DUF2793 domain-containing protein [Xanthobacter sp. TB0139]|uniref:DUF2793 domain-containing protein n=1 Tax=Xanthobacter sp. TB0139 TaxID=3459178 RepID=UPI0040395C04